MPFLSIGKGAGSFIAVELVLACQWKGGLMPLQLVVSAGATTESRGKRGVCG